MWLVKKDYKIFRIISLANRTFGNYKWQIVVLTILGFISGLMEGIGVNALIPLFSFAVKSQNMGSDKISLLIQKLFLFFHLNFNLVYLLLFICLLFIIKAVALFVFSYVTIKVVANYEEQTRNKLFNNVLRADWPYLLKQKLGHLENVLMTDISNSTFLFQQVTTIIMVITGLIMYVVIAINISLSITLITLIFGAVISVLLIPFLKRTRKIVEKITVTNKQISHFVNENIIGIKTVKSMLVSDKIVNLGKEHFSTLKKSKIKIFLLQNFTNFFLPPISVIFISLLFIYSYKSPNFNFIALVASVYLIQKIFQYLQQLMLTVNSTNAVIPYLMNVLRFEKSAIGNQEENVGLDIFKYDKELRFENVYFSYQPGRDILSGVNMVIKKGEMVGLIGPSGAGKTTIVDLILRLFDPVSGKITIDDKNIKDIELRQWRENIGYVSQDIFLTNDTIANNIKFYNEAITEPEIIEAAKAANIYDFIEKCPDKFSTVIGDRGILLSAGQRQRIIIARVLARKPKFLILDEATSALDNESEVKIQKVIENLKGKITVFAIAHRLSTIINSDKLIVLENGAIVEQGTPAELLKDKESYFFKVYNIRK